MTQTYLDSAEDLQWLQEVHGVETEGYVVAILYGNEDCPNRVELYLRDDYRCLPVVWLSNDDNKLVRIV